uniref:Uncharacterized protein n=1 Tax=Rhizophora mucronata TaxID=61149 RepID=A0A2P2Q1C5_RHIMU
MQEVTYIAKGICFRFPQISIR